jgi:cation transporter-like permease
MHCRRYGSKLTLVLWMLVAAADLAIVIGSIGLLATLVIAVAITTVAAVGVGSWLFARRRHALFARRGHTDPDTIAAPIIARRRV